jgi:hypothetical protein
MKKAGMILAILLAAAAAALHFARQGGPYVIALTQSEIQEALDERFPVAKDALVATVSFFDPAVRLRHGSDKIHFEISASADVRINGRIPGARGTIEAGIGYEPERGEFYLLDRSLDIDAAALSPGRGRKVEALLELLLNEYVREYPVYRLKRSDLKQNMARLVLRDVRVEDGLLKVYLGLGSG